MKRSVRITLGAILLACAGWTPIARAATEAEKLAVIRKGLAYLYDTQEAGGYWRVSGDEQAATGAAAFALLSQREKWGDDATRYQAAVDKAIAYLVSTANNTKVSTRNDGVFICPGGVASCTGVYWFGNAKSIYTTGLIAPAIAAYGVTAGANAIATTSGPLAGMTWGQIAQGITNAYAASQSTTANGNLVGGWSPLIPGNGESDSFSTQSAVLSLLYNESLGAVTPDVVKNELKTWLGNVQNASGAVCHQPGGEPCGHAETGGWLLAMKFVGYDQTNLQVQSALAFLNTSWKPSANTQSNESFERPYAMWAVYSGLEPTLGLNDANQITNFQTNCGGTGTTCTWSEDFSQRLLNGHASDGSSPVRSLWTDPITAAFYINVLGSTRLPVLAYQVSSSSTPERPQPPPQSVRSTTPVTLGLAAPMSSAQVVPQLAIKLRPRTRGGVVGLTLDDAGSALASAGKDNIVRIWDPTTGQERRAIPASLGLLTGLAFGRGGATLSSVGRDSFLRVWDTASGSQLARLAGHEHAIRAVAASPSGTFLATGGEETRVMLWDLTTRKLAKVFFGAQDFVNALAFSPDNRLLVSAHEDARVLVFDVATAKPLFTLRGHAGPIDTVAFSPDGTVLATGGQDTVIHLWDPGRGLQRQTLRGHSAPIRTITFSPDGRLIATGGEDTRIMLWNATNGELNKVLVGSTGAINALAFDPKGRFLASANEAGEIVLWNVIAGVKLRTITVPGAQ